jgi:hypothetical protein
MDNRTVIKMPSWFPVARFKRYAREWCPIVVRAVEAPYEKVKRELASAAGLLLFTISRWVHLGGRNGNYLCRCKYYIEP